MREADLFGNASLYISFPVRTVIVELVERFRIYWQAKTQNTFPSVLGLPRFLALVWEVWENDVITVRILEEYDANIREILHNIPIYDACGELEGANGAIFFVCMMPETVYNREGCISAFTFL